MTPQRWKQVDALLRAALDRDASTRPEYLAAACAGDEDLRREVDSLLAEDESARSFLAVPALAMLSTPPGGARREAMRDDQPGSSDEPTGTSVLEQFESAVLALAPDGQLQGVSLRPLEDEAPVAEIRTGPEKYQVLRSVGVGGMGKVYAAHDRDLKRPVALKMIRSSGDRQLERRFLEEAQVMGQLQHPNILPVHELGLSEGKSLYYTMPLVRGRSLQQVLDELRQGEEKASRTYSLTRLVQVFLQVSQAIAYAHAKGVLHRDLKPANVMLGEHGEVQVIDWGLAKVVEGAEVKTDLAASPTRSGDIAGTPAYMSPEQTRGEEDTRTDVYALGAMLYAMLTFEPPFQGSSVEVLAAVVRDPPLPPRAKAKGRSIPLDLERACLKALAKRPEDRQPSVDALHAAVQAWLEAETDRERRHAAAEAKAAEGRARLESYRTLKSELRRLENEAVEVAKEFKGWQPVQEKRELVEAEASVTEAQGRLVREAARIVTTLSSALGFEPDHAGAREALADFYRDRLDEAEEQGQTSDVRFFLELVAEYHDGKYTRELRGDGSLALESDPTGAEVSLYEQVEEDFVLVARKERSLGKTPLGPVELPMGSYLAVLRKEGYRDVRYPVFISRNREWTGMVSLYTEGEIGPGAIFVPAGPFIQGGDPGAQGYDLPRSEPWVEDFFIAEQPVTAGEYLEFLNDLVRTEGMEEAKLKAPRPASQAPTYLLEDGAGGLKLPEVDSEGDRWDPRNPALGISWFDAVKYCEWRSRTEGREYRLPTETEWEKAARGVDGRWFTWGNRFDPSLCNMRESRRERPAPVAVDEFTTDVSVYGVRGMGGNVRDWTSTEVVEGEGDEARVTRVVRGGGWNSIRVAARGAYRTLLDASHVGGYFGFRAVLVARRTR